MKSRQTIAALGILLLLGILVGCGSKALQGSMAPDLRPTIQITAGAYNSKPANPLLEPYQITFKWSSFDPDGYVDHYVYVTSAADTADTAMSRWVTTKLHQVTLIYPADSAAVTPGDSGAPAMIPFEREHEFYVSAVDNNGLRSPWDYRYFTALTIMPRTFLVFPTGENGVVGPILTARWRGDDLDSSDPKRLPVRYHVMFKDVTGRPPTLGTEDACQLIRATMSQPLRPNYNFYVGGDTTSWAFALTPNHQYCLVVKGIDEAGAEDPIPTLAQDKPGETSRCRVDELSTLRNSAFFTSMPTSARPTLGVTVGSQSQTFNGYDPSHPLRVQLPLNTDLSVSWAGDASGYGGTIVGYTYSMDIDDPTAVQPKVTQPGGYVWRASDARAQSTIVPGFPTAGLHSFYIKVIDDSGNSSIAVISIEVIAVTFDRPLLFVFDNTMTSDSANVPSLTGLESLDYYKDVLTRDRWYINTAGQCARMDTSWAFIKNYGKLKLKYGVPLSTLAHYQVVVWDVPQAQPGNGYDYALRQLVASPSTSNNLYTYLVAGGNVWGLGGGFGKWLQGSRRGSSGFLPSYPVVPGTPGSSDPNTDFMFDVLGLRSVTGDTMFSTEFLRKSSEPSPAMRGMDPYPVPFTRQTAYGIERRQLPTLSFDVGRVDTLGTARQPGQFGAYPLGNECLRGWPAEYNPNPDSAIWQPIGLYRSLDSRAFGHWLTFYKSQGAIDTLWIDKSVCAWYKLGTILHDVNGGNPIAAPFQIYFFGFELDWMYREEVRQVADIVLSTKGWNIWRNQCPPNAVELARARAEELQARAAHVPALQRLAAGRHARLQAAVRTLPQNRRR
ncbi:MAG TPA: hypothetical protein VMS93_11540 [Candidatus Saccharimonadales bacterium]|nr:hypothetical protein [Candidatus Saccharimonadales bacterium]